MGPCRSRGCVDPNKWIKTTTPIRALHPPEQVDQTADALSWELSNAERQQLDALVLADGAARMPANPFQSA
jgi:pyridoxine 4-dehydrogenase